MSKKSKKKRARAVQKAAVPAFIGKAAARFAASTAGMVPCMTGHWNNPGTRFCVHCRELMPGQMVPPLTAVKSDPGAYQYWLREGQRTHKSDERELINKMLYGGTA